MNGVITSIGLMIWVYVSMRAWYQAEVAKTWFGVVEAIVGVSFINYFAYDLYLNSASLSEFKVMTAQDVDSIGIVIAIGTLAGIVTVLVRAGKRLIGQPVTETPRMLYSSEEIEEKRRRLDDHKRSLGITVPEHTR